MAHKDSFSRRDVLRHGLTAAGGAALAGRGTAFGQAPGIQTGTQAGRRFRAYITPPNLEARRIDTVDAPEGSIALGYYHDGKVVARGVVAEEAMDAIEGLLRNPVSLALAASSGRSDPSAPATSFRISRSRAS